MMLYCGMHCCTITTTLHLFKCNFGPQSLLKCHQGVQTLLVSQDLEESDFLLRSGSIMGKKIRILALVSQIRPTSITLPQYYYFIQFVVGRAHRDRRHPPRRPRRLPPQDLPQSASLRPTGIQVREQFHCGLPATLNLKSAA